MLHLVFELSDNVVLKRLHHQAGVIFLNSSVLKLLKNSRFQSDLINLVNTTPCYVLNDDLTLHGIEVDFILENIEPIDYAKFVQLTIEHTPIQTWT